MEFDVNFIFGGKFFLLFFSPFLPSLRKIKMLYYQENRKLADSIERRSSAASSVTTLLNETSPSRAGSPTSSTMRKKHVVSVSDTLEGVALLYGCKVNSSTYLLNERGGIKNTTVSHVE
jgi:hypothetical protein